MSRTSVHYDGLHPALILVLLLGADFVFLDAQKLAVLALVLIVVLPVSVTT
jgi:hypothetical protein